MIMQQDPVGLVTFDQKIRASLPPKSRRGQFGAILSQLTKLKVSGETELKAPLVQLAAMLRHRSLIMLMSDLLADVEPTLDAIRLLKHAGHDVIVFHVLDEAEVQFPFNGLVNLQDPESGQSISVNADDIGREYRENIQKFRDELRRGCNESRIDYVPLDTGMPYDKALTEYLLSRKNRF